MLVTLMPFTAIGNTEQLTGQEATDNGANNPDNNVSDQICHDHLA